MGAPYNKPIRIMRAIKGLEVHQTKHGFDGLYTTVPIARHVLVGQYFGKRYKEGTEHLIKDDGVRFYCFQLSDGSTIDGDNRLNSMRKMNHSCSPNVTVREERDENDRLQIRFYAKRKIEQGEELCIDYKMRTTDTELSKFKCLCESPKCRGTMLDPKYLK